MENHIAAFLLKKCTVVVKVTRIGIQVFIWSELRRIDEYGCDGTVAHGNGFSDEARMTFVEIAHGRYEPDGQPLHFPLSYLSADLTDFRSNFHLCFLL